MGERGAWQLRLSRSKVVTDDEFEWDGRKAASNLRAHGVSFEMARDVFFDPCHIVLDDDRIDYGEERYIAIGMADGRLYCVAFTYRGDRTRIISARGAEPFEHRLYHEEEK